MIIRDLEKSNEVKKLLALKDSDPDFPTEEIIEDYLRRSRLSWKLKDAEPALASVGFRSIARVKDLLEKRKISFKDLALSRRQNDSMISLRLKNHLESVNIEISEFPNYSIKEFRDKLDFLRVCISGSANAVLDSLSEKELITPEEYESMGVDLGVVRNYQGTTEVLKKLEFLGITLGLHTEDESFKFPIVSGMLTGEILMCLRKAIGVSKLKLERLSGVTRQHIIRLERNQSEPRLDTFFKLVYSMGLKFFIIVPSYHG